MTRLFADQGWGPYTSGGTARGAGLAIALVSVVCLVLAIGFSVPRIRRRRPAFWIPIVCAAVWVVLTTTLIFAAVAADPAFLAALRTR